MDPPEPFGIIKPNELESAASRPRNLWLYDAVDDVAVLSVRLMIAVASAHAFEQGNKRTGFAAAEIFLDANGWVLDIADWTEIADQLVACIEDQSLEPELADLFRENLIEAA